MDINSVDGGEAPFFGGQYWKAVWPAGAVLLALLMGYYWGVIRFQALAVEPTYTVIPDPYLPMGAVVLLVGFIYRRSGSLLFRGWARAARTAAVLLIVSVLALSAAGVVREIGYRLPGVRLLLDWDQYYNMRLNEERRAKMRWCLGSDTCHKAFQPNVDAELARFESMVTKSLIEDHPLFYMIMEGAAFAVLIAVFRGLDRLVMSGRLGQSRYHYIRLFNRYGVEP